MSTFLQNSDEAIPIHWDLEISPEFSQGRWATSASTVQLLPELCRSVSCPTLSVKCCLSQGDPPGRAELVWAAAGSGGVPPACNCLCAMLGEEAALGAGGCPRHQTCTLRWVGTTELAKPLSLPPVKQSWEAPQHPPCFKQGFRKVLLSFPNLLWTPVRGRRYLDTGDAERNCSSTLGWKSNVKSVSKKQLT